MKLEYTFDWGKKKSTGAVWGDITGTLSNQADLNTELNTIKGNVTTNTAAITLANATFVAGTEIDSGQKIGDKIIYQRYVARGNVKSNTDIEAAGTLLDAGVDLFLGIEWGVISRKTNLQLHNINCISNSPDQHASIIYQDGATIKWYYGSTMTLTSFKNRPFLALIKYTKSI